MLSIEKSSKFLRVKCICLQNLKIKHILQKIVIILRTLSGINIINSVSFPIIFFIYIIYKKSVQYIFLQSTNESEMITPERENVRIFNKYIRIFKKCVLIQLFSFGNIAHLLINFTVIFFLLNKHMDNTFTRYFKFTQFITKYVKLRQFT